MAVISRKYIFHEGDKQYQLYFEMAQTISKFTRINADATAQEHSEQRKRMQHLVVIGIKEGPLTGLLFYNRP